MKYCVLILFACLNLIGCNKKITIDTSQRSEKIVEEVNDSILTAQLELIGVEDQTLRLLLPHVTEKFGRESQEYKYIWSLINKQDSICLNKLTVILEKYGWLGKSSVGSVANQAIWLIIQHSELEIQEKYLPLLKESVANGESEGWHLAFLEDRMLLHKKKSKNLEPKLSGTRSFKEIKYIR